MKQLFTVDGDLANEQLYPTSEINLIKTKIRKKRKEM